MTIPHHRLQERSANAGESGADEPRQPEARQPGPVTYDDAVRRYGPGTIGARERHDELSMRDHLAGAYETAGPLASTTLLSPAPGHGTADSRRAPGTASHSGLSGPRLQAVLRDRQRASGRRELGSGR